MDGITLDHLIGEMRAELVGRHLGRITLADRDALVCGSSAGRDWRLWLDAGRGTCGLYPLDRAAVRDALAPEEATGRTRQALLLFRKHLDGVRVTGLVRVAGERTVLLEAGRVVVVLRLSGSSPALTLAVDGAALATIGAGDPAWPPPPPAPERDWDHIDPAAFAAAVAAAVAAGRPLARAALAACPPLGPTLARATTGTAESFADLRARLTDARPTLLVPKPLDACHDRDLAGRDSVVLAPIPIEEPGRIALHPATWSEAAALLFALRRRGVRFEARRRAALEAARRDGRRLGQLEAHLARDRERLADPALLRRQAEALLAAPNPPPPGSATVEVPDPYDPDRPLRVAVDPALALPANADRLFARARRIERARQQIDGRLAETRRALEANEAREARAESACDASDLEEVGVAPARRAAPTAETGGPRHYLTGRGLSILAGRGARENHHLTFTLARPEDVWLHARDVPGAHVILRDPEGRATPDDLREAAEVAAFLSDARSEAKVDVHVTRRKHLRPARGGPGRVVIGHSDTLRVAPRDPEGRLRRR